MPVGKTTTHSTLLSGSLTFTRADSLFNKPIVYVINAATLIDPITGRRRFSGTGVATLTLLRTENSTFCVGMVGLLDPSLPIPVIPFVTYWHRFKSGVEFTFDPSAIALRKEFNARNSLALSNNIDGNLSLFRHDIINLPVEHAFSTLEMKSGLVYEHLVTKKVVVSLSAGVRSTFNSRVLEGNSNKEDFIKNT